MVHAGINKTALRQFINIKAIKYSPGFILVGSIIVVPILVTLEIFKNEKWESACHIINGSDTQQFLACKNDIQNYEQCSNNPNPNPNPSSNPYSHPNLYPNLYPNPNLNPNTI